MHTITLLTLTMKIMQWYFPVTTILGLYNGFARTFISKAFSLQFDKRPKCVDVRIFNCFTVDLP